MALAALLPFFTTGTYWVYIALVVVLYSIAASGLNVLAGYGGQLSLSHAAFMAIGAYGTALCAKALSAATFWTSTGLHIWLGILVGTGAAALAGATLAIPALRVRGPYLAIVTIAFGWIVWKVLIEWTTVTGGDLGLGGVPRLQLGTWTPELRIQYVLGLIALVTILLLQHRLMSSRFGLKLRAVRHCELAAESLGIAVQSVKFRTVVLSAAICGFAGALFAHQQGYINPDSFQIFDSVFLLLAVLFGGRATVLGPVLGTMVLFVLPQLLHALGEYRLIVYGGVILVTLYWLPKGILGSIHRPPPAEKATKGTDNPASSGIYPTPLRTAASPHGVAALQIEDVSQSYGGVKALVDVSFRVERGTIHAIIGPNGAGKTTLVNIATGFQRSDRGRILLDGVQVSGLAACSVARAGLVRTFQTVRNFGDMTVADHLLVSLCASSRTSLWNFLLPTRELFAQEREQAHALLQFLNLQHLAQVPASELSYGQSRLLDLARAIATRPRVLLLDEPAAGLAADETYMLAQLLDTLRNSGMTIVLVEHNVQLVLEVCDQVTVLDQGHVIAGGTPAEVRKNPRVIEAYLGPQHAAA